MLKINNFTSFKYKWNQCALIKATLRDVDSRIPQPIQELRSAPLKMKFLNDELHWSKRGLDKIMGRSLLMESHGYMLFQDSE